MIEGMLLQTAEGLGEEPAIRTGCDIWERLQDEKDEVAREIRSEGPLCQTALNGIREAEYSERGEREIEWHHRGQLESRLREINEALDRLMDGAYGHCTDCGAQIGSKRLAADPSASLCINCQRGAEGESRTRTL